MRKTMLMTVAALAAAELFAIQGTVSTAVESVSGDVKWHARDKKYIIEKGKITKEFKLADVTSLDIPKPAGFDKAVQAVENGQGASAVATLTKIVADYRMLQWDKPAGRYLTLAHLAAGNAQKAYDVCSPIVAEDKSAGYSGDLASAYWQVLLKLGKREELEKMLKKAATSGDRRRRFARLAGGAEEGPARRLHARRHDVPGRGLRPRTPRGASQGGWLLRQDGSGGAGGEPPCAGEDDVRKLAFGI